ncbi:MAG: hypothetical protein SOX24_04485 [Candidatus Enterosoma sp.]|nr:hypothetical protein [Candidatus Enterosoma sp.]
MRIEDHIIRIRKKFRIRFQCFLSGGFLALNMRYPFIKTKKGTGSQFTRRQYWNILIAVDSGQFERRKSGWNKGV